MDTKTREGLEDIYLGRILGQRTGVKRGGGNEIITLGRVTKIDGGESDA
ncbi:MAG: hypothetical protein ABH864_01845 [archaeon]